MRKTTNVAIIAGFLLTIVLGAVILSQNETVAVFKDADKLDTEKSKQEQLTDPFSIFFPTA